MQTTKNILFITHSNNDLDHFLPLFVAFNKDDTKKVVALSFYNKSELLKNRLHDYMCKENNVQLESVTDMLGFKLFSGFMVNLYRYSLCNVKKVRYTGNIFKRFKDRIRYFLLSPRDAITRIMYYTSKKYIVLYVIFIMRHRHIERFFASREFSLAIIDMRTADQEDFKLKPLNKMLKIMKGEMKTDDDIMFRFLAVAREHEIPILAIPHGPILENMEMANQELKSPFRADFTIHCNITGQEKDRLILGLRKSVLLGDPRYDPSWINYVEDIAKKAYDGIVEKPEKKKVILYIASFLAERTYFHRIDADYHQKIHKDILSLVNYFPDVELWMKFHPRLVHRVPIENYIDKDRQKNIKFFGNEVDTNALMPLADIVVSPKSTILTVPILRKKPLVYYDRWKEITGDFVVTTIFDKCSFILKATDHLELKEQIERILHGKGYSICDSDIAFFYKELFSVDSPYDNMTEKYVQIIDDIVR